MLASLAYPLRGSLFPSEVFIHRFKVRARAKAKAKMRLKLAYLPLQSFDYNLIDIWELGFRLHCAGGYRAYGLWDFVEDAPTLAPISISILNLTMTTTTSSLRQWELNISV